MARTPRSEVFEEDTVGCYHCINLRLTHFSVRHRPTHPDLGTSLRSPSRLAPIGRLRRHPAAHLRRIQIFTAPTHHRSRNTRCLSIQKPPRWTSSKNGWPFSLLSRPRIGKTALVFVNESGKPASAHDLRRSFGQRMADAGIPARDLQAMMRHKSMATTEKYASAIVR
jgi:integrase